jgi:hypothetical protein
MKPKHIISLLLGILTLFVGLSFAQRTDGFIIQIGGSNNKAELKIESHHHSSK